MSQDSTTTILSPPFVEVEGVINIRSIGGYSTCSGSIIRSPFLYRSGESTKITENGKKQLLALGIRAIFDLRSDSEIANYKLNVSGPVIEGVTVVRVPISQKDLYGPVGLAPWLEQFEKNYLETFLEIYAEILESAGPAFQVIFQRLKDNPEESCLIHCTAGKDRTGVIVAVILMLLGVDDKDIAEDYGLTTVGLAPALPMIIDRFQQQHDAYKVNLQGMANLTSSKPETMLATLNMIRDKFGGADDYLKSHTNLTDDDLKKIRQNYLVQVDGDGTCNGSQ